MRLREFATRLNELALGGGLPAEPVASGRPDEAMWTVRTQANEYLVKFSFDLEPQENEYDDYDEYERDYYNAGMNTAFFARDKNGQWTMDITNVGEKELTQIIATVARLLAEFLKQHKHLTHIGISGKDQRRDQIYQRLIQQNLQKYFPGQEFAIDQGGIRRVIKEFAPSPERDDNDDVPDQLVVLANRWWNATDRQPQIEHVLNSLGWSIHQVESEDDAVQLQHRDGTTYFISADDFDPDLFEISRLPKSELGDWGKKGTLADPKTPPKTKPLPGGSGFSYAVNRTDPENIEIMIFDGTTLAAEMDLYYTKDYMKTWKVDTVVADPDYRGQGLGKALYGIALSILKLTLEAGETQTRHGQQMWLMLNSIPGVEVVGYNMEPTDKYQPRPGDQVVDQNADWTRYTFPVKSGTSSMRSGRRGTGIYTSQASMIAKWTGR